MSKHTPGPWMFAPSNSANVAGHVVPRPRPDGIGLVTNIATIRPHKWGAHEVEANARLIAAAPELYEALERTMNWLASYPGGGTMGIDGPYEQARAALAKAKGEA
jgi:hypothetical protein